MQGSFRQPVLSIEIKYSDLGWKFLRICENFSPKTLVVLFLKLFFREKVSKTVKKLKSDFFQGLKFLPEQVWD